MNYAFTVNKQDPRDKHDYDRVWSMFEDKDLQIIYKILHQADEECPHIHYHGVIYTKYIDIKEVSQSLEGYRFEITNKFNPERWHNCASHEDKEIHTKLLEQIEDLRGRNLLQQVMELGQKPKQQKLKTLLKIQIIGSI